jgi:small-conductance mechanosensitive channel
MNPMQEVDEPPEVAGPATFQVTDLIELPPELAFLRYEVLGSSVLNWMVAALVLLAAYPVLRLVLRIVTRRVEAIARRTAGRVEETIAALLGNTRGWLVFLIAVWLASLTLSPAWAERVGTLVQLGVLVQAGLWAADVLARVLESYRERRLADDPGVATAMGALGFLGRVVLWSVVALMALDLTGFEIGPALAGLGVGGIAIALAVQNILSDLFASLSIIFDRPFVIGDFIIVGEQMGTVEHVGLKTTRVRALSGEQLVFSNSDLLNSRVRNFKRMQERRILFHFGVQYDTGYEKLRRIPEVVREIIEEAEHARFDRAHFAEFGDSSLDFEVVYVMTRPDFISYRNTQQAINLELYRRLGEMAVEFAFPTRTLHVHLDGAAAEIRTRFPDEGGADGDGAGREGGGPGEAKPAEEDVGRR